MYGGQLKILKYPPKMITSLKAPLQWPSFVSSSKPKHFSNFNTTRISMSNSTEVEIKLRLPNSQTHQKLSKALSPYLRETLHQENIFFDTPTNQLSSALAALRLRFYNLNSRCILSLKVKPSLTAGISRVEEQEETLDPQIGRNCVDNPHLFGELKESEIIERLKEEFRVQIGKLVCLGGFKNVRQVFDWNGLKLELDETLYEFGVSYEIECESNDIERVKVLIEGFLKDNGVDYSYSNANKFAVFRSGMLPE